MSINPAMGQSLLMTTTRLALATFVQNTIDFCAQDNLDSSNPLAASLSYPYAYARANTPVPAPMPLFGAAAAFGWARRLRNNQKLITSKVCRMNQAAD
jgi:hypothetical protein